MNAEPTLGSRLRRAMRFAGLLILLCEPAIAVSIITHTDITPFYSLSEVMTAKRDGGLLTEIHGGPSPSATPASITAPLRLPARVGGGTLIPLGPGTAPPAGTRLVLLFNATYLSADVACRSPERTGARRRSGELNVFAVLCHGERYFSQAHLRDGAVNGESDAGYAAAMTQLFLGLLPSKDEVERDRGDNGRE